MSNLRHSLYWKFSLANLGLLIVFAAIQLGLFALLWRRVSDESEQVVHWGTAARIAAETQHLLSLEDDFSAAHERIFALGNLNPSIDIYILDKEGNILADFVQISVGTKSKIDLEPIRKFLRDRDKDEAPVYGSDPRNKRSAVFSAAPILLRDGSEGFLYVVLKGAFRQHIDLIFGENSAARLAALFLTVSLVITGALGFFVFWLLSRRFQQVTHLVRRFANGDFSERVNLNQQDEIGELANAVNHMADTIVNNISELEQRDRLRRELIADVSHDLRGPAALINGYAELLLLEKELSGPEAHKNLDLIFRNGQRLTSMLSELFELARLEANEEQPKFARVPMKELIADTAVIYEQAATSKGITLREELPSRIPPALGDTAMLQRVLANLIDNAIRHTSEGGKIVVRALVEGALLRISVADSGEGISPEALPRVFEKFYQEIKHGQEPRHAGGLGLAITKKIVEAHGGKMEVESIIGQGTVFSFLIPIDTGAASELRRSPLRAANETS